MSDENRGDNVKKESGVTVIGDLYPVERVETGLWSLDRALGFRGHNGVPLRSILELYGHEHSGKSTLAWHLAANVRRSGTIWIADLEGTLDKEYIEEVVSHAGFQGTVRVADYTETKRGKSVLRSHEAQLQDAIDALLEQEVHAAVVDSVGMFNPIVERDKDLGERSVGQRAKTIADASRRVTAWLRIAEDPKLCVYINHVHPKIGPGRGYLTPGGVTKNYAANVRIWLQRIDNKVPDGSGNFLAEAKVQKLKFGGANPERTGLIYFIPGYGVSREMTAVFDCVKVGIAKREATIKLKQYDDKSGKEEWVSMGYISALAQKAEEPEKHQALFQNFFNALTRYDANS